MANVSKYYVYKFYSYDSLKKFIDGYNPMTLKIVAMSQENGEYTIIYYFVS